MIVITQPYFDDDIGMRGETRAPVVSVEEHYESPVLGPDGQPFLRTRARPIGFDLRKKT